MSTATDPGAAYATVLHHFPNDPEGMAVGEIWYNTSLGRLRRQLTETEIVDVVPSESSEHVHVDGRGFVHRCLHKCRSLFTWQFFVGITLSFPIEHALWTKVPGFYHLADLLGLGIGHH